MPVDLLGSLCGRDHRGPRLEDRLYRYLRDWDGMAVNFVPWNGFSFDRIRLSVFSRT